MDIKLITAPTEEQVLELLSVEQLRSHENFSHNQHDDRLKSSIIDAYGYFDGRDGWLNRSIVTQEWLLWLPRFEECLEVPLSPLQSVDAISYFDADGQLQSLPSTEYEVIDGEFVGQIRRAHGAVWPALDTRRRAVKIEYTAGFGTASTIDMVTKSKITRALKFLASHLFRNPASSYSEPRVVTVNRSVNNGLEQLVGMLRVPPDHR